jgi:hypothetical protein
MNYIQHLNLFSPALKYLTPVFFWLLFFMPEIGQGQQVCGVVLDEKSREPLIGATIYQPSNAKGTFTDNHGFFCLTTTPTDSFQLQISFIGYETKKVFKSNKNADSLMIVLLTPGISMEEIDVVVKSKTNRSTGIYDIPMDIMKKMPGLTGDPDLLKNLQMMPGVKMGDEGSSVFYVRGGTPDQNLTLIDDVPLYYVNHIGGFLSVFDMNTIKKATLYKGYYPANFGGRLSSVLDIRLKDGDVNKTHKEIMIGTLASKFFIEGPMFNKKFSGMFSARRCNLDLFMLPITAMNSNGKDITSYTFYDLTGKVTWTKNARNKFSFMTYAGRDKLYFKQKDDVSYSSSLKNTWGNIAGSITWNHFSVSNWMISSGLNFTKFYRVFDYNEVIYSDNEDYKSKGEFSSKIGDLTLFSNMKRSFDNFDIKMGVESTYHKFTPSAIQSSEESNVQNGDTLYLNRLNVLELRSYIETDWDVTKHLSVSAGIFSMYWHQINQISFDPRISVSYSLPGQAFIKTSYAINHQFIHLLSNNSGGLPVDLWIPSSSSVKPESAEQFSVAFSKQVKTISFSIEAYTKKMDNLIYYKPGYSVFNTLKWDDAIEKQGQGFSKGIELLAQKLTGRNTGWIGYTLSKDTRKFENINQGNTFPFKYGRLHEINIVYAFDISDKISMSANWIFASGNFVTLAKQKFPAFELGWNNENYFIPEFREAHYYGSVNNFQTAAYHRLDVGFNFKKQLKKGERNIYVGVYNLYNRQNPYYYYFKTSNGNRNLYQYSLFPIIPSFSYTYKW